jgi:expansin (peptidoglycan-binding protein)
MVRTPLVLLLPRSMVPLFGLLLGCASTSAQPEGSTAASGGIAEAPSLGGSVTTTGGTGGAPAEVLGGSSSGGISAAGDLGGSAATTGGGTSGGSEAISGGASSGGVGAAGALGGSSGGAAGGAAGALGGSTGGGADGAGGDPTATEPSLVELLPPSCSGACTAATPVNPTVDGADALGNVTMYSTEASAGGACLYGTTGIRYYAAINVNLAAGDGEGQWQAGHLCGQCVEVVVLTSQGPQQVVVRITDKCADEHCGLDLGGDAPAAIMLDGFGRYEGAWRLVSCVGHPEVSDGPPSLFVKDGSNPYWAAVQIQNPSMGIVGIDWSRQSDPSLAGSFEDASASIENYYLVPAEVLAANDLFDITVRYRDGSTGSITLSSAELGQAEATYPMD